MKFSIVTPSYNQQDWLLLCIKSIKDQINDSSELQIEHIIQDAKSEKIEDFAQLVNADLYIDKKEIRKRIDKEKNYSLTIYSERDSGMYDAINKGFEKATGDIFLHLNSDEQLLPNVLQKIKERFIRDEDTDIFFGDAIVVNPKGELIAYRKTVLPSPWITRAHTLPTLTCATFYRRRLFSELGLRYNTDLKSISDKVWILKALDLKLRMKLLEFPTSVFTLTGSNLMWSETGKEEARKLFFEMPLMLRLGRPIFKIIHRFNKWRRGAYRIKPVKYAIYTLNSLSKRTIFCYQKPKTIYPNPKK